jgi:4-amino-4-deoxy-L-arabinose transferase-like glycosyltransferase
MKEILKNRLFWIIMIIILAIAIRMFGVGLELFSDENVWAETVINSPHLINQPELYIPHPPLAVLGYIATTSMFGLVPLGFRIFPLMVGVISIIVVYLFSSELYDRKTGLITSLLMAITFYPIWASLYVDVDGNLLLLFTVLTVFSYFKFSKTKDKKFIVLTGIFLGLSMLSKYPAILIPVILLIYDFMETKLKNLKSLLFVFLIGAAVF